MRNFPFYIFFIRYFFDNGFIPSKPYSLETAQEYKNRSSGLGTNLRFALSSEHQTRMRTVIET